MTTKLVPYPELKDSGVDWLGAIPAHWHIRRMRTVARILNGATPSSNTPAYWDGSISWITPEDLGALKNRYIMNSTRKITLEGYYSCGTSLAPARSLAISTRAPIGHIGILGSSACVNQGCKLIVPHNSIDSAYLYRILEAGQAELKSRGQGTTFAELSRGKLADFPLPVPPLPEQNAIVRFLDHADRRIRRYIRAKQKLIALLEEQKQAVIHQAVTGQIDVRTAQPYPAYKPSGVEWLGDVPAHWDGISLGAASHSIQTGPFGSQLHVSDYVSEGVPVINPSHIRNGGLVPDPSISIAQQKADELSRHKLRPQDIVMARRGEVGRCALVTDAETDWLCGTGSLRIRPRFQTFVPEYLLLVLSAPKARGALSLSSIGATMNNINAGIVSKLMLSIPSLPEQVAILRYFHKATADIDTAIDCAHRQIELLHEYLIRLIAEVVTGKLDVREAAASLPEVDPLAAEYDQDDTPTAADESDFDNDDELAKAAD